MRISTRESRRALVPLIGRMTFAVGLMGLPGVIARPASPADLKDRGVFVYSMAGKQIGTESFEISSAKGKVEAEAKVELRVEQEGKTLDFKTSTKLVLTPDLQPQTYDWNQKGAQSSQLQMDFRSTPATVRYRTVSGENDVRDFQLPRDVVVLDNNVIHHYQLVVRRFRQAGGGTQTFYAFIPQEALPGTLSVEEIGRESVDLGSREQKLHHLLVTTENAQIDLWADDQDRLQKISIPRAQLEVVRKK